MARSIRILTCFLTTLVALWSVADVAGAEESFDHTKVTRLRWAGPPGSEPDTYEDFVREHDLFITPPLALREVHRTPGEETRDVILIVVEEDLYPLIEPALIRYILDLEAEGNIVLVCLDDAYGGSPADLRDFFYSLYSTAGLNGVLLVGDLPVAWHESTWDDGEHESYPCDYFFMDLDGDWGDVDENDIYDLHDGDRLPEIWLGRLVASTLYGNEADYINNLLNKSAAYRRGSLFLPRRGLTFIDDDWSDWATCGMDSIYPCQMAVVNDNQATVADSYKVELAEGYETVQLCAHSWPGGHHFDSRPSFCASYAHIYIESDSLRECQLRIGGEDGLKVWLNGEVILMDADGTWEIDGDHVPVTILEGINSLLIKVAQYTGTYWFAARFTDEEGNSISGLTYHLEDPHRRAPHVTSCEDMDVGTLYNTYPDPQPSDYIHRWLTNGIYKNHDSGTLLSWDYLDGEASVHPARGDTAGSFVWVSGYDNDAQFDLEEYFSKDGGWVQSNEILAIDPDGLLYNLFACSAARYTQGNYVAGRYTFANTFGLATIGSAKTGSMLNFEDFYGRLGQGSSVGEALMEWFRRQGEDGFENWEVCWYYGLTLIGDPTLSFSSDGEPPAAIADLSARSVSDTSIVLSWVAPGDDGLLGEAARYDLRYSSTPVETDTVSWWEAATPARGEPSPSQSGVRDSCVVYGLSPETSYHFVMRAADERPNWSGFSNVALGTTFSGIPPNDESTNLPRHYSISQNYPNPFNLVTTITYAVPRKSHVRLEVYNLLGQRVATLVDELQSPGYKTITWDASSTSSGIYLCTLTAGDFLEAMKVVLLK